LIREGLFRLSGLAEGGLGRGDAGGPLLVEEAALIGGGVGKADVGAEKVLPFDTPFRSVDIFKTSGTPSSWFPVPGGSGKADFGGGDSIPVESDTTVLADGGPGKADFGGPEYGGSGILADGGGPNLALGGCGNADMGGRDELAEGGCGNADVGGGDLSC
jgi:hypothetical protein